MTYSAVIFDLDGVISDTASLHSCAWKTVFNLMFARIRAFNGSGKVHHFDVEKDYHEFIDGKSRLEGIRSFLDSRHISLPPGGELDINFDTVNGISNIKNSFYLSLLESKDDVLYGDSIRLINSLIRNEIRIAVGSSSKNCHFILKKSNLYEKFNYVVGGEDLERNSLRSKPSPDIYVHAANKINLEPKRCIVIEDAPSGVLAAVNANIGLVIGLERNGSRDLKKYGADFTIGSLDHLALEFNQKDILKCDIKKN